MTGIKPGRRKGLIVQTRDCALLAQLSLMRLADRDQLMVAGGFTSITRINTRLLALYRSGLLRRFFIGFGAARKALYAVSAKGAQLAGVPMHGPRRKQNELLAADSTVLHQLSINDLYCNLRFHPVPVPGVTFTNWLSFPEIIADNLRLIPDGYVEFQTQSGIDAAFLEVDLGSEELKVWKEKARQYVHLAASGEFSRRFKHARFRVLVLADSSRRLGFIRRAVAEVTQKLFWFAVLADMREDKFFAPVWFRPTGDTQQPLFQEPR